MGSVFADYVEKAGLEVWPKVVNNLRASMETDLLNGKYGTLGIQTIADWLGRSPKVMLKHYKRVREDDFTQVTQSKVQRSKTVQNPLKNDVKSLTVKNEEKSPDFCVSPLETNSNDKKELTVYLTVQRAAEVGIGGYRAESALLPHSTQTLEYTALTGKKQKKEAPFGNLPQTVLLYQSGEDRIQGVFCKSLNTNNLQQVKNIKSAKNGAIHKDTCFCCYRDLANCQMIVSVSES